MSYNIQSFVLTFHFHIICFFLNCRNHDIERAVHVKISYILSQDQKGLKVNCFREVLLSGQSLVFFRTESTLYYM